MNKCQAPEAGACLACMGDGEVMGARLSVWVRGEWQQRRGGRSGKGHIIVSH